MGYDYEIQGVIGRIQEQKGIIEDLGGTHLSPFAQSGVLKLKRHAKYSKIKRQKYSFSKLA